MMRQWIDNTKALKFESSVSIPAAQAKLRDSMPAGARICWRCKGLGGSAQWSHTDWYCYNCNGCGYIRLPSEQLVEAKAMIESQMSECADRGNGAKTRIMELESGWEFPESKRPMSDSRRKSLIEREMKALSDMRSMWVELSRKVSSLRESDFTHDWKRGIE